MIDDQRYPTAVDREKAKLAGIDTHPGDKREDPMAVKLADFPSADEARKPNLKHVGGSNNDQFNIGIVNSVMEAAWCTESRDLLVNDVGHALAGIGPRDELEGMLAAQMVAAHQASMECYRRAMVPGQTIDARSLNLKQGTKASQTYAALLDTLNRHRAKGQQKVVVEHVHRHVHVHESGAPIVDHVDTPGAGGSQKIGDQPHAQRAIEHAPQPALRIEDAPGEPVPRTGDAERSVPHARRREPRRAKG